MSWLRTLLGGGKGEAAAELDSDAVRQLLFDAATGRGPVALARACGLHKNTILDNFAAWQVVPEEFRTPEKFNWYAAGLSAVARHFAEKMGHRELWASLAPPPEDNRVDIWKSAIMRVDDVMKGGRYEEGSAILRETLARVDGMSGPGVDVLLSLTLGRLGECLFQSGRPEEAVEPTERALEGCRKQSDDAGLVSYLGNLYEIHRYRGDAGAAARQLERLAQIVERRGDSRGAVLHRRQASVVKAGEPLCRVVGERNGERFELADAPRTAGQTSFVFVRNRIALRPSTIAASAGKQAGSAGQYDVALSHFRRAAAADGHDPWPPYHMGQTLLYLRRYAEAAAALAVTEALAPGFHHCRSDYWLAERLSEGTLGHETFLLIDQLNDATLPPAVAADLARAGLAKSDVAPLRLALGKALAGLGRHPEAEHEFRRGLMVSDEVDVRTRLLVELGIVVRDTTEKAQRLNEALKLRGNLIASAMAMTFLSPAADAN